MVQRALYRQSVPKDTQLQARGQGQRRVQTSGSVADTGSGVTENISVQPSGQRLEIGLKGAGAGRIVESYAELFDADGLTEVAFYGVNSRTPTDGYYVLEGVESEPVIRGDGDGGTVSGRLRRKGTRKSHWRAIKTNPFSGFTGLNGGFSRTRIVVPDTATKVRWSNRDGETEEATPINSSVATEQGAVDIYDVTDSSYETSTTNATLIYDLPYTETGKHDAKVWDTHGNASKTDGNGVLQWQKVYRPDHVFEGEAVLDTGRIRVYLDDEAQTISAETWDSGTSSWSSVTLGTSDWVLYDIDLTNINQCRVDGQFEFSNTDGGDPIQFYRYDIVAHRGKEGIMFKDPINEDAVDPTDLDSLLDPIKGEDNTDPTQKRILRDRQDTRL